MKNNNKGNGFIEFVVMVFIVIFAFVVVFSLVVAVTSTEEESEERIVESSEVVEKTEKYMVIVYKDNGLCDTLYSNSEGDIKSMGEFIFYKSDDFDIVSKHTIISIPIKDKVSDMNEYGSGIDLDDY